jgi:hypothetical protein
MDTMGRTASRRKPRGVAVVREPDAVMHTNEAWIPSGEPVFLKSSKAECYLAHRGGYAILGQDRITVTLTKVAGSAGPFMVDNDIVHISCNGKVRMNSEFWQLAATDCMLPAS